MTSILDKAQAELTGIGVSLSERRTIVGILRDFHRHFDSGGSVSATLTILTRLLHGLPLTPLTGEDSEWWDPTGEGLLLQNRRCYTVFKNPETGECFDVQFLPNGADRRQRITFPYTPQVRA
jgi:hypothetical protein